MDKSKITDYMLGLFAVLTIILILVAVYSDMDGWWVLAGVVPLVITGLVKWTSL